MSLPVSNYAFVPLNSAFSLDYVSGQSQLFKITTTADD